MMKETLVRNSKSNYFLTSFNKFLHRTISRNLIIHITLQTTRSCYSNIGIIPVYLQCHYIVHTVNSRTANVHREYCYTYINIQKFCLLELGVAYTQKRQLLIYQTHSVSDAESQNSWNSLIVYMCLMHAKKSTLARFICPINYCTCTITCLTGYC